MLAARKMPALRWAGAIALLAGVVLGALAVVHRVPWRGTAVHLWSEGDLPVLPAEGQNGWALLHSAAGELAEDARPGELRNVERLDWPEVKARADEIRAFTGDSTVRRQVAAARNALSSPAFTDACPLDLGSRCDYPKLMRLHDLVTLSVLSDALSGNWEEALRMGALLLRADLEMMRTSRTALSALTARGMVRKDLRCLGVLLDGMEIETPTRVAHSRAGVALAASVLAPTAHPDAAPTRAVIAEYILVTREIRTLSEVARSRLGGDWTMVLLLDRERTVALANVYFEALMRFARSPSTSDAPRLRRLSRERFGWWAYNAGGKMLLDTLFVDLVPALREIERQDAQILAASTALRERALRMAR